MIRQATYFASNRSSGRPSGLKSALRLCLAVGLTFLACPAKAHVGSPDVFYQGDIGPYPAFVTIRMPNVVPGRAEIVVRVETNAPVELSFRPLYSQSSVTNAPPADIGRLVRGETNLYSGELWLMTYGGYSIEVKLRGAAGDGAVEIPVNSVALQQMPLPRHLGAILSVLGVVLVLGLIAIVIAAARDSVLAPGTVPDRKQRRKGRIAGAVACVVLLGALAFGRRWWNSEERTFRHQLLAANPIKLGAETRIEGSQRILRLTIDRNSKSDWDWDDYIRLLPDHGKLVHLFLVREGTRDAFAHLHPIRKGGHAFELPLPPLPPGRYDLFCDLTLESSGLSCTATNTIELPALPAVENVSSPPKTADVSLDADPDDSWTGSPADKIPPAGTATNLICQLPGGQRVIWKARLPLRTRQDAGLQFEIQDADGKAAPLEPYMGMMSHAAVMRLDGTVFAHLHPSGNYSMAAQDFYEKKLDREFKACAAPNAILPGELLDPAKLHHVSASSPGIISTITLPYEFPTPGDYRVWVQFKTGGKVFTAVFDATVQ